MIVLFRLSTFEAPGVLWDRGMVLRELNFGDTIDAFIKRLEATPARESIPDSNLVSPWRHIARPLAIIVKWWKTKIEPRVTTDGIYTDANRMDGRVAMNGLDSPNGQFIQPLMGFPFGGIDSYNDFWVRDIFVDAHDTQSTLAGTV
jgi:hypothetical protein